MRCLWGVWLVILLWLVGCGPSGPMVEREVGYRGPARRDAFLAFQRMVQRYAWQVSHMGWTEESGEANVLVVPVADVTSELHLREMQGWLDRGVHVILWGANAVPSGDDWIEKGGTVEVPEKLASWLQRSVQVELIHQEAVRTSPPGGVWTLQGKDYEIGMYSYVSMRYRGKESSGFQQIRIGRGLLSVVSDARMFRNRYLDQLDHPAFVAALLDLEDYREIGVLGIVRGQPPGFLAMLWERAWPVLLGIGLVVVVWLWKNLPRSGPKKVLEEDVEARGYEWHLEALGDFYWRLDKGVGLLQPMRDRLFERAQTLIQLSGRVDMEPVVWLAQRSGLPEERVMAALASENPPDSLRMVRVVADLQKLQQSVL